MKLGISGKRALVTGAGRGLGLSIAKCLAEEDAKVAVIARTEADLDRFVSEHGKEHVAISCDLADDGAPTRMVEELRRRFGEPDIVVHNVGGTLDIVDPFCDVADWRKVYRFNLEIAVELNLLLVPHMQRQHWGRIVHISSIA